MEVNIAAISKLNSVDIMEKEHISEYPTIRLYTGDEGHYTQFHIKDDDSNLT